MGLPGERGEGKRQGEGEEMGEKIGRGREELDGGVRVDADTGAE